jgi:hypothetical protein
MAGQFLFYPIVIQVMASPEILNGSKIHHSQFFFVRTENPLLFNPVHPLVYMAGLKSAFFYVQEIP